MMADRIELKGLECFGHHGVLPEEKEQGQRFVLDITCWLAFDRSDELDRTVNYAELAELAHRITTGPARDLIETVAAEIADEAMARWPMHAVEVKVHKLNAPIPLPFEDVAVVARRRR